MKTSADYDCLIPAWYLEKHKASGTTMSYLHFPHCEPQCFGHGRIHPEYSITYNRRVALNKDGIHIGSSVQSTPSMLDRLPKQYHKFLLLFDPEHAEKLPDHRGCDPRIELIMSEYKLRMGPIYQLSQEEEKILVEYLEKMIKEKNIRPSSSSVGSPNLLVPKPSRKGLRLSVDYQHLNDHTKKDKTPFPIMDELSRKMRDCDFIRKIDMKVGFHLMRMAMGHEKFTPFRTKFGLYEYMVMPFGLPNAPATFQRQMNRILRPHLGMELVLDSKVAIDEDGEMVVVVYVDDILIATKGSLEKHHRQVSKVFQLLMDNHMCVEIDKCVFDAQEVPFLGFIVSGTGLRMDPNEAKAIVDWPRPTTVKEVQQLLGFWNFYRRFVPSYAAIVAPITDLLRRKTKHINWGEAQEAAVLKITILFTSGKSPILRHYDPNQPALVETEVSDFAIAGVLSQKFEDGKLHPVNCISRKLSQAELNYDVYDKEMFAIVFSLRKWRYFLQGAEHRTIVYSDHQNLTYFETAVSLNRRQARWAEELLSYCFDLFYHKGSSNQKADALSRCPAFTSREGGTTASGQQTLFRKEQWVEIGAMQLDEDDHEEISIGALAVEQLLPEAKERIKQKAMLDEDYITVCRQLSSGRKIHEHFEIKDDLLCWKNRLYVPKGLRGRIMDSEHNSKVAGHFGRERTMELLPRNF